jgi:hypothetical protein
MNAHNNNNDPFEDVFRDRFADFESEPDTQLWQKIEPKLPVDSTRKFPYWQISTVAILLLAGLWIYLEKFSDDVVIKLGEFQTVNANPPLSVSSQATTPINSTNNPLIVNNSEKNTTNNLLFDANAKFIIHSEFKPLAMDNELKIKQLNSVNRLEIIAHGSDNSSLKSEESKNIAKLPNRSLQDDKETFLVRGKSNDIITEETNKTQKSSLFSNPNTTIEVSKTSFNKPTDNNFSKNNTSTLNPFPVNNSNEKQGIIIENPNNNSSVSSVFSNKEIVSVLNKNFLTTLDSKNYSLLKNHFKTPKLKFVVLPKKDDYFKERKPLEMYASVMPLLNYYTITPNGNDANFVHSIAVNGDEDRLGFYTQAGLVFTLSDKFKLRTGLTFTKTNHSINYQIRTDSLIVQPSDKQGVDVSFEELKKTYSQSANYLGTKIEVQYTFLQGEALSHYVNVGLEGAYRLNGGHQLNGFANFAYGVTRQIGDNAYLFVEPTFSYSLNQQSDNNSFLLVKPNKIGFNIGVNFKIK